MSARNSDKSADQQDPYRKREQAKYERPIASREYITSVLNAEKGPVDFEALAEKLELIGDDQAMEALRRRVGAMLRDGQLIQNRRRGLVPVDADALVAGRISAHPDGFGFVIMDDGDKDIYLNGKQMRQVLHGDRVVVCITGVDQRGRREGRIVEVVERANKSLVGRLSIDRGAVVVLPDNKRIHQNLLVAPGELAGAKDGDMVVAEIVDQPTRRYQPVGKIIEVLGQHLRPGMEIDVALHSHGIPSEWPEEVMTQAAAFSTVVEASAAAGRKDVRDLPLITIDGADARDFDDAVWCERLEKGWRLMVAIADVAHYVVPDSPLDVEAVERGTSVYFPGRVVPMLPEVLSNGLCSLNPEVERLCMICELTLDNKGTVKKTRFHNGIMRSHARLTYDQVSEMLTDPQSSLRDQHAPLVPMIEELHRLYKALAAKRRKRGAIEFQSNETHILFDENKKIREIIPIQRNDAHKLIEECMILANIQAAAFLEEREIPALYRVHAGPKADRLEDLHAFLALRDLTLGGGDSPTALDYAALAAKIADRPDRSVIETVMLRSMQQAVYQPKNEGHFGLALEQYAHFTSPIRRYPDLLVHRALKHAIARGTAADFRYSQTAMQTLGESCSMTERRAEDASRDVVAWLKCEYMQEHVGSEFKGVISAVTSFGLFVELVGIHVEGLVHITNLSRDYYRFDQAAHALTGERTGKQYHLGDPVVVKVAAVNLEDRKIDFLEVEHTGTQRSRPAGRVADQDGREKRSRRRKSKGAHQQGQKRPTETLAVAVAGAGSGSGADAGSVRVKNAEQRRKEKRRAKQKRRDAKRAAAREAKRLEAIRLAAGEPGSAIGKESAVEQAAQAADGKAKTRRTRADKRGKVKPSTAEQVAFAFDEELKATSSVKGADEVQSVGQPEDKPVAEPPTMTEAAASKKTTGKKVAAKKAASKKATGKKVAAKKAASKKATGKKVAAKKAAGKKATGKKVAAKKAASKKAVGKKVAAKKAVSKKATGKKVAAKKAASKKAAGKKVAARQAASKQAASKKTVSKKAVAKTAVGKKATGKKVAAKKAASKKATGKKVAAKKAVSKKATGKKVAARKVASKKAAGKKVSAKKTASAQAVARKTASKRGGGQSAAGKKASVSAATGKKAAGKKTAAKKAASKKTTAKKAVAKKATGSKKAASQSAVSKRVAQSSVTRKKRAKKSGSDS